MIFEQVVEITVNCRLIIDLVWCLHVVIVGHFEMTCGSTLRKFHCLQ